MGCDEVDLGRLAVAGDSSALDSLLRSYQPSAYMLVLKLLRGDEATAEDLLQEALLRITRGIHTYHPDKPFKAWATVVTVNVVRDYWSRKKRRDLVGRRVSFDENWVTPSYDSDPVWARQIREGIEEALDTISPAHAQIIRLRHYDGLTYSEIQEHLAIPKGTAMNRLFRARQRLRDRLRERGIKPK